MQLPEDPDGKDGDEDQHDPDQHIGDGVFQVPARRAARNGQQRGRDGRDDDESTSRIGKKHIEPPLPNGMPVIRHVVGVVIASECLRRSACTAF
ncbi:hypothetical protein D3C72_1881720 [compost metagenome]